MIQCLLCHSSGFRLVQKKGPWRYLKCLDCGLVCLDPRPSEETLLENYQDYLPLHPGEIRKWEIMMKPVVQHSAHTVGEAHGPIPGRLLDVGSGFGFFLKEMQYRGWEVEGIELSMTGRLFTRKSINATIHDKPVESLCLPEDHFDVITLFYVIEHLPDPLATMKEVFRILKPGGRVLLRWPHSTPIVRLLGPFSRWMDLYHTPFHLYDFSAATINLLLSSASFQAIKTCIGGYSLPPNPLKRWCSILTGRAAEALWRLSHERFLLPGVSKTTVAQKPY